MVTAPTKPAAPAEPAAPVGTKRSRRALLASLVVVLLIAGLAGRSIAVEGRDSALVSWLPWLRQTPITVFYQHPDGLGLVPVSRRLDDSATAADVVASLLAGPDPATGLQPLLPAGTASQRASLSEGLMTVDLSGDSAALLDPVTVDSVWLSLASWPAADRLALTLDEMPIQPRSTRLLYFWDPVRDMLVAQPTASSTPGDILAEYLAGPASAQLVGLPADVELRNTELNRSNGLFKINLSYTPSVREFALADPNGMRRVLEGLIATMTITVPGVDGVYLDFDGQSVLGLGNCADLLRSLQVTPKTLNDERLLARAAP